MVVHHPFNMECHNVKQAKLDHDALFKWIGPPLISEKLSTKATVFNQVFNENPGY